MTSIQRSTVLTLRKIGNSQGLVLPKSLLEGLDFSRGIEATKDRDGLHLRPAQTNDPFGFGAAFRTQLKEDAVDPLLVPDVLPDDDDDL